MGVVKVHVDEGAHMLQDGLHVMAVETAVDQSCGQPLGDRDMPGGSVLDVLVEDLGARVRAARGRVSAGARSSRFIGFRFRHDSPRIPRT
jgi:hypothetical protein